MPESEEHYHTRKQLRWLEIGFYSLKNNNKLLMTNYLFFTYVMAISTFISAEPNKTMEGYWLTYNQLFKLKIAIKIYALYHRTTSLLMIRRSQVYKDSNNKKIF